MNVLITGDVSSIAIDMAKRFIRNKIKVVLTKTDLENPDLQNVVYHPVSPESDLFPEIISAYKFDVVVFVATREEQLFNNPGGYVGKMLDGLSNTLTLCKTGNVKHLFFISSTEIYGNKSDTRETIAPVPVSPNGFILEAAEQQCKYHSDYYGVKSTILRVPYVYGENERNSFLYKVIKACKISKEVTLPTSEGSSGDFLHVDDLSDLVLRMFNEIDYLESGIVNLSGDLVTFGEFANAINQKFPDVLFHFDSSITHTTKPVSVEIAKTRYNWEPDHLLKNELPELMERYCGEPKVRKKLLPEISNKSETFQELLKWIELTLGAAATQFLVNFTGTPILFKYIDFRLLFVVLMGIVHGTRFGLLASLLASASVVFSLYINGVDWTVLVNSVEYWVPFALYLAGGVITGYTHDKKENEIRFLNDNNKLIHEKYTFLYNVYNEIRQLKDQFHDQLLGYRDSFGRIFNITQELDSLQEEEILFRALNILETVMENNNIAIYSLDTKNNYARLVLSSPGLNGQIEKSLKLSNFPDISEKINQGDVFQNTTLQPDYPIYFAPIKNGSLPIAAVAIWEAKFEQQTLYHFNLFKVICGLIQSSIIRATIFETANAERIYIPSTRILHPEAFKEVLKAKQEMKVNKNASFQLVKIDGFGDQANPNWAEIYANLSSKIRSVDVIGTMEDNNCYVVLSQADPKNVDDIVNRMKRNGISCELINDRMITYA